MILAIQATNGCIETTAPKIRDYQADAFISTMTDALGPTRIPSLDVAIAFSGLLSPTPYANSLCSYNRSKVRYDCSRSFAGITQQMSFQYVDATNHGMQKYDESSVSAFITINDLSGSVPSSQNSALSASLTGHGQFSLQNLLTAAPQLIGSSTQTIAYPGSDASTTTTTVNLVLPPLGTSGYPSGTIQVVHNAQANSVVYDGTSVVAFTEAGKKCTKDLAVANSVPKCVP
jgi:hypothetical protein